MQIEVSEQTNNELQRRAQAAGLEVGAYLEALVAPAVTPKQDVRAEPLTVEELRTLVSKSSARLERNGRPWRELTHEGHKY